MVYARYTFELAFPKYGDYTAFFEGCCRPPVCHCLKITIIRHKSLNSMDQFAGISTSMFRLGNI